MNAGNVVRAALWLLYSVFWFGGVGSHLLFGAPPREMAWTAPLFLFLASLLAIASTPRDWRALAISFFIGLGAEVGGVATGYPFGRYHYSTLLAPAAFGVPIVVAGAWMVLVAWVRQLRLPTWAGALAMTAFDLVIDPLAANTLGYWHWSIGGPYYGVPLSNFAGWFTVSLVILLLLRQPSPRSPGVVVLGCSILLFFAIVSLVHAFFVPTVAGFLLAGAGYWRWRSSIVSTRI